MDGLGGTMTPPTKPKVVQVYRDKDGVLVGLYAPIHLGGWEYLGEYAPRGQVIRERWETRWYDDLHEPHCSVYDLKCTLPGWRKDRIRQAHDHARIIRASGGSPKVFHIVTRKKAK